MEREENSAKLIKRIGYNYESGGASTSLKKALASREKEAWGLTVRIDRQVCSRNQGMQKRCGETGFAYRFAAITDVREIPR